MEFDIMAHPSGLREAQTHAREIERLGFSGAWFTESGRTAYLAEKLVDRYRGLGPNVRITTYTAPSFFDDAAVREKWGHVAQTMRDAG